MTGRSANNGHANLYRKRWKGNSIMIGFFQMDAHNACIPNVLWTVWTWMDKGAAAIMVAHNCKYTWNNNPIYRLVRTYSVESLRVWSLNWTRDSKDSSLNCVRLRRHHSPSLDPYALLCAFGAFINLHSDCIQMSCRFVIEIVLLLRP